TLADGTYVESVGRWVGATLKDTVTTQVMGDGHTTTIWRDANGDAVNDQVEGQVNRVEGSSVNIVTDYSAAGVVAGKLVTVTSLDGLKVTSLRDSDGDGIDDRSTTRVLITNADGSTGSTLQVFRISEKAASGSVVSLPPTLLQTVTVLVSADAQT